MKSLATLNGAAITTHNDAAGGAGSRILVVSVWRPTLGSIFGEAASGDLRSLRLLISPAPKSRLSPAYPPQS